MTRRKTKPYLPRLIQRRSIFQSPYLSIHEHRYRLPGGREAMISIRSEHDVVVCAAVTAEGHAIFLQEFRYGPDRYLSEAPGGMRSPDTPPAEAALAELLEETGYTGQAELICSTYIGAYSTAKRYLYAVRDCIKLADPIHNAHEQIEVVLGKLPEISQIVRSGETTDLDVFLVLEQELSGER